MEHGASQNVFNLVRNIFDLHFFQILVLVSPNGGKHDAEFGRTFAAECDAAGHTMEIENRVGRIPNCQIVGRIQNCRIVGRMSNWVWLVRN